MAVSNKCASCEALTFALIKQISSEVRLCQLDIINPSDTYIEPFMGGARIFLNCPMPQNVILNEYDKNITSLFRIIQRGGDDLDQLIHELQSAAYCRENFEVCTHQSGRFQILPQGDVICNESKTLAITATGLLLHNS
jgi:site-specific DNA-adenine methylase